jgi:mevalonate kinase
MIFSAKSKTFLVGEYAVLFGGRAILLATDPEFQLVVSRIDSREAILTGMAESSPGFLFFRKYRRVFDHLEIKFLDPYDGGGGFGASSAQYVLLYRLYSHLTGKPIQLEAFLDEYRYFAGGGRVIPSGADCVLQLHNRHIYFDSRNYYVEPLNWNFPDIEFAIFRTNTKVPTHDCLQNLPTIDVSDLNSYVDDAKKSFLLENAETLCKSVINFSRAIVGKNLATKEIGSAIDLLLCTNGVLAAKGCGAMLADTIVVIFQKKKKKIVLKAIEIMTKQTVS